MRKVLVGVSAAFLLFAVAVPGVVYAQDDSAASQDQTTDQATNDGAISAQDQASDRAAERAARIEANKQRVTDRLSVAEERRIGAACSAAQEKVAALQGNLGEAIENRRSAYADISAKLDEVVRKLHAASVDTTGLEAAITEMNTQSSAVLAAAEAYQSTLADLAAMDCASDPNGFQATLTVAREQRATLVAQAQTLRDYITVDIKAILQAIREQLATNDAAEES